VIDAVTGEAAAPAPAAAMTAPSAAAAAPIRIDEPMVPLWEELTLISIQIGVNDLLSSGKNSESLVVDLTGRLVSPLEQR
jgi:hypothetical protein